MIESFAGATALASCSASCSLALLGAATGGKDKFTGDRGETVFKSFYPVCLREPRLRGAHGRQTKSDKQQNRHREVFRPLAAVFCGWWLAVGQRMQEESILIDSS